MVSGAQRDPPVLPRKASWGWKKPSLPATAVSGNLPAPAATTSTGTDPPILQVPAMPRMAEQCVFTRRVRRLDRLTEGLGPSNFPRKN
jgi:hypothetical protein